MSSQILFKPVTLSDKNNIESFILQSPYQICNFSFANLIIWGPLFLPQYAVIDNCLVLKSHLQQTFYNFPIGNGDKKAIINHLIAEPKHEGKPFVMRNITESMKSELETWFPDSFRFSANRDFADYLYLREDLVTLSGKKYQPKRNHIHQFEHLYQYEYKRIEPEDIEECLAMHTLWVENNMGKDNNISLQEETMAVHTAFEHFENLGMQGGLLKIDNEIVAFTLGCPINQDTFDVNIEKAKKDVHGAYTMINKLFVEHELSNYKYINREDDLGESGLRQAKLSYHPYAILEKYTAEKI